VTAGTRYVVRCTELPVFTLIGPATEQPFATIALGQHADVDRAVAAARRAFPEFSRSSKEQRLALLERIVREFEAREDAIMSAVSREMGAPLAMKAHTRTGVEAFRQALVTLRDYGFETRMGSNIVRREPIGVCGLITAWNWPVQLICTKLAAAFAAGCTVVWKPSEFTPLSALALAEVMHAAAVPPGVFNLVNGDGPTVGHAISSHPDIEMVSFTGSTRAGVLVAQDAAPTVKRVCQELGGKSANIILPDADLAAAARWNVARGFSNSGQSCHSPTRILVQEQQMETMLSLLQQEAAKVKVGDPADPQTTLGPVVNKAQFERIQRYIHIGLEEGARLVCGGPGRPEGLQHGYFIRPTIFAGVTQEMTIAREEIFGPVLAVLAYTDEAQAVQIANATNYGLGGYVFSADRDKAYEIGAQMRAGRIFYNGAPSNYVAPMGGYRQSGNGREMGVFGLEEYLEVKSMIGFEPEPAR
jgi:aldehyde dehydrogenase (NAD+)